MISPDEIGPPALAPGQGIYPRLVNVIAQAKARRAYIAASSSLGVLLVDLPVGVYLGEKEWAELKSLCADWGVEWSGAAPDYNPVVLETTRSEFTNVKIYRVDAASFLAAT